MKPEQSTQPNLYFRNVFRRSNPIKEAILNLALGFCSYPRMLIEVFIRKSFGRRYFSFGTAIFIFLLLLVIPTVSYRASLAMSEYGEGGGSFWLQFATWYLLAFAFLVRCIYHQKEIKTYGSAYDFNRFTLSAGDIHERLYMLKLPFMNVNPKTIEIVLEPALAVIVGFVLFLVGQSVGMLLIVCGIFYSLSYVGAYHLSDNFMMDKIDEIIMNEEQKEVFVNGIESRKSRGVRIYGDRPSSAELREKLVHGFNTHDDDDLLFAA